MQAKNLLNDFTGNSEQQRKTLIDSQLRPNNINQEDLLEQIRILPREIFVPSSFHSICYGDTSLPVGKGRHLLSSFMTAQLLNMFKLGPTQKALVIGCSTGYSMAILSGLVHEVWGVEADPELCSQARTNLATLDITNAHVHAGAFKEGLSLQAPFDVIIIEGAAAAVPLTLLEQLAEGGQLATILRETPHFGRSTLICRSGSTFTPIYNFEAMAPYLPTFEVQEGFIF